MDRLLAITMTLLNQPRVSATELAKRFEVSLRTIYRDMESINQAGIPIVSFAGSDGGYEIMPGYRLEKQVLSLDDFSSIYAALRGVRSVAEGSFPGGLLDRIGALMSEGAKASERASLDIDLTPAPNDREKIAELHETIKALHLVRFAYTDQKGAETERTIEPMGLFLKGFAWYLYGFCLARRDVRVFRLSRMSDIRRQPQTFLRRDITLKDVEDRFMSQADFARVGAVLRFAPEAKARVKDEFGYDRIDTNADGTVSVAARFSSMERAVQKILSYSGDVEVLGPPELIAELRRHVRALARLYQVGID